jgi:hypothetical protein
LVTPRATPAPSLVPVQFEKRPSEPQRTRYHLTLPGARLPIVALRLEIDNAHVFRRAMVTEARLTAWQAEPVTIGRSALVRETANDVVRLPMQQPSQREIDLVIEDEANAPLDIRAITAELAVLPSPRASATQASPLPSTTWRRRARPLISTVCRKRIGCQRLQRRRRQRRPP